MKKKMFSLVILFSAVLIGCSNSDLQEETYQEKEYTLAFIDDAGVEKITEAYAENGYYFGLIANGSYRWGDQLKYPKLPEAFSNSDIMNLSIPVSNACAVDGYRTIFCQDRAYVGGGMLEPSDEFITDSLSDAVNAKAGYQGRLFLLFTAEEGACNIRIYDQNEELFWEKERMKESFQIYLEPDDMPSEIKVKVEDCSGQEEKDSYCYFISIVAAVNEDSVN